MPNPQTHQPPRTGLWIYLILLLSLGLHTFHMSYPAWDYHNWRQTITLMVARDFARHGFPLLHPQVAWIGKTAASPSYFNAEFSIQSILAALLYQVLGESDTLARLVTIAFSLLGIYCLYDLLNRRGGRTAGLLGALIYAMFPYQLFFGRVFMPDIPALALALAALDVLDRWSDSQDMRTLLAASVLTGLAILQKLTVAFIALPMLYILWSCYGSSFLKRREPYILLLIATAPAAAWYYIQGTAAAQGSVLSALAMQRLRFGRQLDLWVQSHFLLRILGALGWEAFSLVGLGLVLAGILFAPRDRAGWIFRLWLAGAALTLLMMPGVVSANLYYFTLLLPGGAALAGVTIAKWPDYVKVAILPVFAAGAIYAALPMFQPDRLPHELGTLLNSLTAPTDLLATESGGSPNVLYYADRRGWLLEKDYNVAYLAKLQQAGARYYANTFAADAQQHRDFFGAMDSRFQRLTGNNTPWQIYDLAAKTGPMSSPPAEMGAGRTVNFADQIQFRGTTLRPLMGWPASFEVIYYWQCMRTLPADLRIFVHITGASGQTAMQQDHWPQNGAFPTSRWKPGDIVQERYVLTLDSSMTTGKYQIHIGWFDLVSGARLPIMNPSAADRDDRALVSEIELPPRPSEGWFGVE